MYKEYVLDALYPGLVVGLTALAFFGIAERLFPKHAIHDRTGWRGIKNVMVGLCYRLVASPLIIVPLFIYFLRDSPFRWHRPEWYSGWWSVVVDFILLDLLAYVLHIAGHKIPILWRFHAIHHIDTNIDSTTGIRVHFGEKLLDLVIKIPPIILLGVPIQTAAFYEIVSFAYIVFHHNNIRFPEGLERVVGKVFVTPTYHGLHHGRRKQYTDSNYSVIFSFWDVLFGTRSLATRPEHFPIGLNEHHDYSFMALMTLPFTSKKMNDWNDEASPKATPIVEAAE